MDLEAHAFRTLRRHLARRRLSQLDPRLRFELALLAMLLTAFVFWQIRGPLASLHVHGGARPVWAALAAMWAVLTLLVTVVVAFRHARRLRIGPPGPAWLALPVSNSALAGHLAWDSGLAAAWIAVPVSGAWAAAWGLVPEGWLVAWVVPVCGSLILASRAGGAIGERLSTWGLPRPATLSRLVRVLATAPSQARGRRLPPARWARRPAWLAICAKDALVTRRLGSVRWHVGTALSFWLLSVLAWRMMSPPGMRDLAYVAAFVLALLGSAALSEWLVALSGSDPFTAVRALPVGVASIWGARFAWGVLGTGLLLIAHALAAQRLSYGSRHLFLGWVGAGTLAIATLGVNYGVTLFPRADLARRLLGLSLGLAVVASLMIPLLGWVVLLAAVLHSARRLPNWYRLEEG